MLFDSQQEHYLWISLALSILLSIIIPIRLYIMREDTKKKNPEGITFGKILIVLLWWGIFAVIPLAVFIKFLPLIEAIFGLGVTILMCIMVFLIAIVVWKNPESVKKYHDSKRDGTSL